MKKNWKLILVAVLVIAAVLVFVKLAPAWASVTGLISFCVGFVAGWLSNVLYNRYKKE